MFLPRRVGCDTALEGGVGKVPVLALGGVGIVHTVDLSDREHGCGHRVGAGKAGRGEDVGVGGASVVVRHLVQRLVVGVVCGADLAGRHLEHDADEGHEAADER